MYKHIFICNFFLNIALRDYTYEFKSRSIYSEIIFRYLNVVYIYTKYPNKYYFAVPTYCMYSIYQTYKSIINGCNMYYICT